MDRSYRPSQRKQFNKYFVLRKPEDDMFTLSPRTSPIERCEEKEGPTEWVKLSVPENQTDRTSKEPSMDINTQHGVRIERRCRCHLPEQLSNTSTSLTFRFLFKNCIKIQEQGCFHWCKVKNGQYFQYLVYNIFEMRYQKCNSVPNEQIIWTLGRESVHAPLLIESRRTWGVVNFVPMTKH